MERQNAYDIAKKWGWLSEVPSEIREVILARCELLHFRAEQSIYNTGDEPGGIYGVVGGLIQLSLLVPEGGNGLAHIGGPGLWVGDAASITGQRRRITISAASDCQLLRLTRARLLTLADEWPQVWQHVAYLASKNLILAIDIIDALRRDDPVERVAATILNLQQTIPPNAATLNISQSDLGTLAKLSRSRISSALNELQKSGWLRLGYATIEITDRNALSDFVRGN